MWPLKAAVLPLPEASLLAQVIPLQGKEFLELAQTLGFQRTAQDIQALTSCNASTCESAFSHLT